MWLIFTVSHSVFRLVNGNVFSHFISQSICYTEEEAREAAEVPRVQGVYYSCLYNLSVLSTSSKSEMTELAVLSCRCFITYPISFTSVELCSHHCYFAQCSKLLVIQSAAAF